jgi:aminoglycoside phosphotransferase (APT) family kinase protein
VSSRPTTCFRTSSHLRPASLRLPDDAALLTPATVGAYLRERGFSAADDDAVELGGGVSNVVLGVRIGDRDVVVKQALPRLRVTDEWTAKRERALNEAAALELAGRIAPAAVPRVLDVDTGRFALVVERAPAAWRPWKEQLLAGAAETAVATRLGELLASWHRSTSGDSSVAERFGDDDIFEQLRLAPYHRTVAERRPELADAIHEQVDALLARRSCLVHGDYSPKNVLIGDGGLWVIDFEVAHYGDPVFDIAFLITHLLLKAIRRPESRHAYERCATAFLDAYGGVPAARLLGQVGCLVSARVDGKSPVEYLDGRRKRARALGAQLLLEPPPSLAAVWRSL